MLKVKLTPHVMDEGQPTAQDYLSKLDVTTLKIVLDIDSLRNGATMSLLNLAASKNILIVGRRYDDCDIDLYASDMQKEARRYYDGGAHTQSFTQLAQAFPMIQIWEGVNEPDVKTPVEMQKYASFCAEFAKLMSTEAGRRAGIGSWAVGTPDVSLWQYWFPALAAVKTYNAVLTRHSYGPYAGEEGTWFALRHRRDQTEFTKLGYANTSVIISETGTDTLDNAASFNKPWRTLYGYADGALDKYWAEWGKPFTEQINQDSYVIGAHWFTFGNGGSSNWNTFDLAHLPVADTVLANPPVDPKPPVPLTVVRSRPESDNWLILFSTVNDLTTAKPKKVTWDMVVSKTQVDAAGVIWYKVSSAPELWVLSDQTTKRIIAF